MNDKAVFIMPVHIKGNEFEIKFFKETIDSIKNQTDDNWLLVMIDDYSNDGKIYEVINGFKNDLKDKLHVIYLEKNSGPGMARNYGIKYANEIGADFILFNDSDDISDPRRLELTRKAFMDKDINVVYTGFDVIDEYGNIVLEKEINMSIREIIDGHKIDVVQGDNAFVQIAIKKNYTNLTSCTAVRTSLAVKELFPKLSVSEDSHTWMRYGAHPGKFYFINEIKGKYRICSNVASRSRGINNDFYKKKYNTDCDGFEQALIIAQKYNTLGKWDILELRTAFYVRLALALLHGGSNEYCEKSIMNAYNISKENTLKYINELPCELNEKNTILANIKS